MQTWIWITKNATNLINAQFLVRWENIVIVTVVWLNLWFNIMEGTLFIVWHFLYCLAVPFFSKHVVDLITDKTRKYIYKLNYCKIYHFNPTEIAITNHAVFACTMSMSDKIIAKIAFIYANKVCHDKCTGNTRTTKTLKTIWIALFNRKIV